MEVATACKEAYPDITVRLIHSRDRVFHQYDEKVSDRIAQYCAKKKIDIITNQRVKHISKTTIELSEGDEYPSDITILTAGIRINDDSHSDNLSFDETHATDKKYCPVESDNVFACGDVACHGLSATAHNAMIE